MVGDGAMTTDDPPDPPDTSGGEWTTITDLKVSSTKRIYVKDRPRHRHGLEVGKLYDVVVHPDDRDEAIYFPKVPMKNPDRPRLHPPRQRVDIHDLTGELIDIDIREAGEWPEDVEDDDQ